jgi:hypothetical protein
MKISIIELRDMVAKAVRQTVNEAKKKPKLTASRSAESNAAIKANATKGLPGYNHAENNLLDMSKPLGKNNRAKMQGASGIGNWTSESVEHKTVWHEAIAKLVSMIVDEEIRVRRGR